jgi:nucleoside-diphosphate-sugar epimerase
MTILMTGATGLIGSALLRAWTLNPTDKLHAISRKKQNSGYVTWHDCDLFHERSVEHLFDKVQPTHIIHAAWETTHGRFWTCESNRNWLSASLRLLDAFERHGGKRFVFLGSMAEYDWTVSPLTENHSSEIPFTLYGQTKLGFHRMLMQRKNSAPRPAEFSISMVRLKSLSV